MLDECRHAVSMRIGSDCNTSDSALNEATKGSTSRREVDDQCWLTWSEVPTIQFKPRSASGSVLSMLQSDQHCGMDGTTRSLALLCVSSDNSTPEFLQLPRPPQAPQFSTYSRCGSCSSLKITAAYHGTSAAVELVNVKHLSDACPVPLGYGDIGHRNEIAMAIGSLR
jgi:hypothetical protein